VTTVVISQPMLFPWVGMFEQVALADVFVHYDDVQFSKGSFTNRVQLKAEAGSSWMTVPLSDVHLGQLIRDLKADDSTPWRERHLEQLRLSLSTAPFLDPVLQLVADVYATAGPLVETLIDSVEQIAGQLDPSTAATQFVRSSDLPVAGVSGQRVLDIVRHFEGTVYVTGHGAKRYLDATAFEDAGVEVRYMDYACQPYPQGHGEFTPFVTVLDLLANAGPRAGSYLDPRTVDWRSFLARP
jgi:hypothetical protein